MLCLKQLVFFVIKQMKMSVGCGLDNNFCCLDMVFSLVHQPKSKNWLLNTTEASQ